MTPIQTYGQTTAPSNMQFPTAAYLQSSQNAAEMKARGMESLGRGLAGGIEKGLTIMQAHKDEEAKFNATKKAFKAFGSYLDEPQKKAVEGIFADTTMSTRDKNALSPILLSMLASAQQQRGKEEIANIMTDSREAIAAAKNRPLPPPPVFNAAPEVNPLDQVVSQAPAAPAAPYMIQRPQGQPQPTQGPLSNMPKTREDPLTKRIQFWSPEAKRYVDELENDLIFGPDFRIQ